MLSVCDCPTRINKLEARMERQKFTKMIDLSDRIYLKAEKRDTGKREK